MVWFGTRLGFATSSSRGHTSAHVLLKLNRGRQWFGVVTDEDGGEWLPRTKKSREKKGGGLTDVSQPRIPAEFEDDAMQYDAMRPRLVLVSVLGPANAVCS